VVEKGERERARRCKARVEEGESVGVHDANVAGAPTREDKARCAQRATSMPPNERHLANAIYRACRRENDKKMSSSSVVHYGQIVLHSNSYNFVMWLRVIRLLVYKLMIFKPGFVSAAQISGKSKSSQVKTYQTISQVCQLLQDVTRVITCNFCNWSNLF
jgi:hypothetical protein